MWRMPASKLFFVLLLAPALIFNSGCSSKAKKFAEARQLQEQGHPEAALRDYVALLGHIPANQPQINALLEFHIGECLWVLQRPKEAYEALRKSVEQDSANPAARLRLAEVALAGGAPEIAVDQTRIVLSSQPNNLEAVSVMGAAFASQGNTAMARSLLQKVVSQDPAQTSAAIALAEIQAQQHDFASASSTLQKASAAAPHDASPWLALARMEEIEGNPPAAEHDYRSAIAAENSVEANLRLAQFLARTSRISESEAILANLGKRQEVLSAALPDFDLAAGRTTAAIEDYRHIAGLPRTNQSDSAQVGVRIIEALLQDAQQHAAAGDDPKSTLDTAENELRVHASQFDPATQATLTAELALARNDLNLALAQAARAAQLSPQSAPPFYVLGLVDQRVGNVAAASAAFEHALEQDPKFLPARQALARQQLASGDARAAEESISQVVLEEPANFDALCLYAKSLAKQGRAAEAVELAHRAQAANPGAAEPRIILGDIAADRLQLGLALLQYEQAILLEPRSPEALSRLTQLYRNAHVTTAMLAHMRHIAGSPPASAPLMEIAGRLYAQHGALSQAASCFREALRIEPGRTTAAAALLRIDLAHGKLDEAKQISSSLGASSASLTAGVWAGQHGDMKSATRDYEEALAQGDQTGIAANNLAWIYAQQGVQLERALVLATAAHDASPQSPEVMDTVGMVRFQRHEYSKAIDAFRQALALSAHQASAPRQIGVFRAHLKKAYLFSGDNSAARAVGSTVTSNLP